VYYNRLAAQIRKVKMSELTQKEIKEITGDGGIRSRKLWAFIIVLAITFPLIWFEKLSVFIPGAGHTVIHLDL